MSHPPDQHPLTDVKRSLFRLYVNCQLEGVHPFQLYQEYDFNYEQLAMVAGCNLPTLTRWMNHHQEPRSLKDVYTRRLGEFYFLLKHYEQIPIELWDVVCPLPPRLRAMLYPSSEP